MKRLQLGELKPGMEFYDNGFVHQFVSVSEKNPDVIKCSVERKEDYVFICSARLVDVDPFMNS